MALNTINQIDQIKSVISWQLVVLVEETRVPRENHQPAVGHWQTVCMVYMEKFAKNTIEMYGKYIKKYIPYKQG